MTKSPDAFRTISEVAEWLGIQAHVLRFWESKFTQVKPVKRAGGRRYYRPADMQLLGGIRMLLHDDGMTIKGVQKILREQGVAHVSALSPSLDEPGYSDAAPRSSAKVLPFSAASPADTAARRSDPTPPAATPAEPVPQQHEPQPEPLEAEPTTAGSNDDTSAEPDGGATSRPEPETPVELPEFLTRPAESAAFSAADPGPEAAPPADPQPVPPPRPGKIEAADPPDENDIAYVPGPMAWLAQLNRLNAKHASQVAPLARELRDWKTRIDGSGAA